MRFTEARGTLGLEPLWTDAPDAAARLARKRAAGLPEDDATNLEHFIDHGWLTLRGAIEQDLVDLLVADINRHHTLPGLFVTTDHRRGRSQLKLSGNEPDRFESLFDLYVNLSSSRQVCMHPKIVRFLELIFDGKALAFQQLLFQRSNGHQAHSDTAFVAVEEPLQLVATWIALQDVVEGSGELAFWDRSHMLPHVVFADGSVRSNPAHDDLGAYPTFVEGECQRCELPYERFLARKGDVFFWSADLIHRSHPRTLPETTPRLSCVTHYCPMSTRPFWYRSNPENRGVEMLADGNGLASVYYRLPNDGQLVRPNWKF